MPDLYFHHYETSPFAEKIRLIFAFKGLKWHSVLQPPIMPKEDLVALTAGYRRIPVLQIGNHVVCDTPLICDVLERLAPTAPLYPELNEGAARAVAQWADSQLFAAAMAHNFSPTGAAAFFKGADPEFAKAFAEDRKAMRQGAARMSPSEATPAYRNYLARIDAMLRGGDFLFGSKPTIADFSAYHPLWFTRRIPEVAGVFNQYPRLLPWMDRMVKIGADGKQLRIQSSADDALKVSRESNLEHDALPINSGDFTDLHSIALGQSVSIVAESFGTEATHGTLVAAGPNVLTIAHENSKAGKVFVHFPRLGFVLKPAA